MTVRPLLAPSILMHNGEDIRRKPFAERKAILRKVLVPVAVFNTSNTPKVTARKCSKPSASLALRGIVSKKLDAPYKSGPSKAWLKIKNPDAPAATRALDGTF
jgi:bifunctional non-homologous end joining protein LigD